ncbi:MAG: S8 family serine peptidase [Cyclobacteriaceae bacterium]|nr:S8 family serine peptidase [Cyclobacteriaceae bacterium]
MAEINLMGEASEATLTVSVSDTTSFKRKYKGKLSFEGSNVENRCFLIRLTNDTKLEELGGDANVIFIDHHKRPKEEGVFDYLNWSFNRVTKARNFFPEINGVNQNVSIKEQGFDPLDINLSNRSFTTSVTPSTISHHATIMTTLMSGGGNTAPRSLGVAYQSSFTSSDFNNLFPDNSSIFNDNNIRVQNHSYGIGIENYYGIEASAYDKQIYENPTLLHVFSSGNSGKSKPSSGIYQNLEWANLTGNFKQSKNVLVVNAVDTSLLVNPLNSRGPAFDGRLKPELTAFGFGGTSDAAAVVSGISLLIRQQYLLKYQKQLEASMVKAILIASAEDLGQEGIDYLYGYGNVNAYKALTLVESKQLMSITLLENDQISIPITIPGSVSEVKIVTTWSDPAAIPNSSKVLVNDIDSWLTDGVMTINPWVLSGYPTQDSLRSKPKRKQDHLNNTEYITLNNPAPGIYQLVLKSGALQHAEQKVSIAWWWDEDQVFSWDFPVLGDFVEGGEKNLLVWEAKAGQQGDLNLQMNDGIWQPIHSGIDLNKYFYWIAPDTLANARLKMTIGSLEFVSDKFIINPTIKIKSAFNCSDSVGLTWNSIKNATAYQLYTMGSQYLQKIQITNDTLIVLPRSTSNFFSVAPIFSETPGIKSETINATQQGANCYLNLFAAERFNKENVRVQIQLSSRYLVDHIIVHKIAAGSRSIFQNIESGNLLDLEFYDPALVAGLMSYQAEIVFKNGTNLFSEVIEIPIEEKNKAIIYPNPVSDSDYLTVLSSGDGVRFQILDVFGRTLFEKEINIVADAIDIVGLPTGIYFYRLLSKETTTDTGRLIKN